MTCQLCESQPSRYCAAVLILCVIFAGCGGDSPANNPPAAANAPASKPAPEKPKTTPKIIKNKPKTVVTPSRAPSESSLTEYVMLDPQGYELEADPTFNQFALGSDDVDPRRFLLFDTAAANSARNGTPWTPDGLEPTPDSKVSSSGAALSAISLKDNAPMVLIPAGQFRKGNQSGDATETPDHTAYVSAFYMDAHEVTVGQFNLFADDIRGSELGVKPPVNEFDDENHPALGISFRDAQSYATWAGKSLPTESQWERAARGDNSLPNVWGRGRPLWSQPRQPGQITDVQQYPNDRSLFGVYDLAGNAREWCRDFWDPKVYEEAASEPGGVARDWDGPKRPKKRNERTVRGTTDRWSVTARSGLSSADRNPTIGFRCVVEFDPETVDSRPSSTRSPIRRSDDPD